MSKLKKIPAFKTKAEERAFWQQQDSANNAKIGKYRDGLTEVDLLQLSSPGYAPACILTVNRRLLSAEAV